MARMEWKLATIPWNLTPAVIKSNLQRLLFWTKNYVQRIYVLFWHGLSMDPAVRESPYVPPPENEVILDPFKVYYLRLYRILTAIAFVLAVNGLLSCIRGHVKLFTILWAWFLFRAASVGITAGAHRLWSHRSFKATWQLRLLLMIFQTSAMEFSVYTWVNFHRLHHKYSDTEYDPHNSTRGFFFSHVGWLFIFRSPELKKKLKAIPMKDIEEDKIVMFQKRNYIWLASLTAIVIPTLIPWYFWSESLWNSFVTAHIVKYFLILNCSMLINSAAHMWGMKPYDKNIKPVDSKLCSVIAIGEGWHNYHHVFPWDYKTSELGFYTLNVTTAFIDFFARIGWAYDLKTVPKDVVAERIKRTGDGSHSVWGWNDSNLTDAEKERTQIRYTMPGNK